jgi:hypothetical protein
MIVMANRNVHVFKNTIANHGTTNIMVIAYREKIDDPTYNALPRDIVIRDNVFGRVGFAPAGDFVALAQAGVPLPDILWDGATTYVAAGKPRTEPVRIDIRNNTRADKSAISLLSLGVPIAGGPLETMNPEPRIPPVSPIAEPPAVRLLQR